MPEPKPNPPPFDPGYEIEQYLHDIRTELQILNANQRNVMLGINLQLDKEDQIIGLLQQILAARTLARMRLVFGSKK